MTDLAKLETQVAGLVCRLPPMPVNLERVMEALRDVGADEEKMVRLIQSDPGLCAELLHLANTCFGETGAIATVEEAVRCVGIAPLVEMIAASYAGAAVQEEFRAIRHLDQYFAHSREIATTARILARVCHQPAHECESFNVAGSCMTSGGW